MTTKISEWGAARCKAIWGPKRLAAVLFTAAILFQADGAAAQRRGGGHNSSGNKPGKSRSGLPNSFASDYRVDKHLTDRVRKSRDLRETVDLIVTFSGQDQQLPNQFRRFICGSRLDIINGYALCDLPLRLLNSLSGVASVHRVHHNRPASDSDLLSSTAVQADTLAKDYGYNGAGVTVAFIDSGLTDEHPDLNERKVLKALSFVDGRMPARSDQNGHGTHVTGIVAGTGEADVRFTGVAPGAKVISLKVLDEQGHGSIGDVIAAMDWVSKNHKAYNIRIVNMSVGAGVYESYWTDPLTLAAKALVDEGITVVAAAGNFGKNEEGKLQWGGITSPGVAPWVLTTCAFSTNGTPETHDDTVAEFSSAGPAAFDFTAKPDICAPGVGIVSLAAPESALYRDGLMAEPSWLVGSGGYAAKPYLSLTGTSQAAPFVTGTVAMMLQANPALTPNLIKAILQYTATVQPDVSRLRQGAGFLNAIGAVTLASFYAHPEPGSILPVDESWSQQIIWGNYLLSGGVLDPDGNAWMPGVEWGWAKTQGDDGDNIVWGTECRGEGCERLVWGFDDDGDNIVWGTADDDDNIVWGTADDDDNIVWGTECSGEGCERNPWSFHDDGDNIVWGTADDDDNIVWGTADDDDNIVWGTADDIDNIVWGTDCGGRDCDNVVWGAADDDDNIVWGTADDEDNIVWGTADDEDNIVWGTECSGEGCERNPWSFHDDGDNIVWGTADDDDNIVWGTAGSKNIVWPFYKSKGGR